MRLFEVLLRYHVTAQTFGCEFTSRTSIPRPEASHEYLQWLRDSDSESAVVGPKYRKAGNVDERDDLFRYQAHVVWLSKLEDVWRDHRS